MRTQMTPASQQVSNSSRRYLQALRWTTVFDFNVFVVIVFAIATQSITGRAMADPPSAPRADGPKLGAPKTIRVRLGLKVVAVDGPCSGLRCGFPMPVEWPEQKLTIEKCDVQGAVKGVSLKPIGEGVKQARFLVSRLARGEEASVIYTVLVERRAIAPPPNSDSLMIPPKPTANLRPYLTSSPKIETDHPFVREAAKSLDLPAEDAWSQVQAIRDFTERRVKYSGVKQLEGALRGLKDGSGDCEERTSVFVAMCRLKGIPARSIWRPGHAYAEFYLENESGAGNWYPAESVGGQFGFMGDDFLILQKGDKFRDPLKRGWQRYLTETAAGNLRRGDRPPRVQPVREQINENGSVRVLH